jgi:hypothetical protein
VLDDATPRPMAAAIENVARAKFAHAQRVIEDARPAVLAMYGSARRPRPAAPAKNATRSAVA